MQFQEQNILKTGIKGKCPRCGVGNLFEKFTTPVKSCAACQLDMSFAEEGDGPAIFAIFILGFVIVGLALIVEFNFYPPIWVHMLLWIPITAILAIFALKIIKGIMIAAQYKTNASQGVRVD